MRYVGIDVGKKRCQGCVMDEQGAIANEFVFDNTHDGIQELLSKVHSEFKAVLESTGNLWLTVYEALEDHGIEVKLANPSKTKAIASAKIKTDRLSARILAHLLRSGLIAECYVSSRQVRRVNALLRQRASLVKMQTMVENQVHSLLDRYGYRSELSDEFGIRGMEWLRSLEMNSIDRCILDAHIRHLEYLKSEISLLDTKIASLAYQSEDARLLMTLTGIDYHSALLIASEIGDVRRVPSPKHLVSWIGLCPSLHQSGSSSFTGKMKKDSNRRVRWVLVQAAQSASRTGPRMKELHDRIAAKRGENKATIRVANKMASVIWHILTKRESYRQVKERLYRSKLMKIAGMTQ